MEEEFILNNTKGYHLLKKEIKLLKTFLQSSIEKELLSQKKAKVVLKERKIN